MADAGSFPPPPPKAHSNECVFLMGVKVFDGVIKRYWDRQAIDVNEAKHLNANDSIFETVALDLSAFADSEMALAA